MNQQTPLSNSAIKRCLKTADGKVLLEYLRDRYDNDDLAKPEPIQTYFALGAREVYRDLLYLLNHTTNQGDDDE